MTEEKKEKVQKKEEKKVDEEVEKKLEKPTPKTDDLGKIEKEDSIKKKKEENLTDKIRENPWVVATVVLGIVVLILLIGNFSGPGVTGASVADPGEVEGKVLKFINSQVTEPVEIVDTQLKNGLYEILISYQGREIPVYVTADGQNLVQGVTPLDQLIEASDTPSDPAQQPTTETPKADVPKVELFVMSICPFGTQAEKGILPVVIKLGDKIDFDLRFVSYAMHEKPEMDENTVQYCIQKEQEEKLYDYLECYLEEQGEEAWSACRSKVGIDETKLQGCIAATDTEFKITELYNDKSSWSGGRFPQYNVDAALNTQYGVRGSPTLVINGVVSSAGRSPASYLGAICAAFNDAPEECNVEMPADTPAPGFGWDALAASDTAAQCG